VLGRVDDDAHVLLADGAAGEGPAGRRVLLLEHPRQPQAAGHHAPRRTGQAGRPRGGVGGGVLFGEPPYLGLAQHLEPQRAQPGLQPHDVLEGPGQLLVGHRVERYGVGRRSSLTRSAHAPGELGLVERVD
jgi:hypothetical protein